MPAVQHIVLLQFKQHVTDATVADLLRKLGELQRLIPGITSFGCGQNTSPEGMSQGFTHAFWMTFASPAARDAYLPHAEHERVKAALVPAIDRVVVVDVEI